MSIQPYYERGGITIFHGDCVDVLRGLDEASIDAIVTDPPYGLEFMGKEWDKLEPNRDRQRWAGTERKLIGDGSGKGGDFGDRFGEMPNYRPSRNPKCRTCGHYRFSGSPCRCDQPDWDHRANEHARAMQEWHEDWAREAFRVLKPGGHLLAFGGTRTYHRMACAIEDAGFEIRDQLQWLYGSGFPKSHDVSKAIDKAAGALGIQGQGFVTAGHDGRAAEMRQDKAFRSDYGYQYAPATPDAERWQGWGTALKPANEPIVLARKPLSEPTVAANVLRWGTGALAIDACRLGNVGYTGGGQNRSIAFGMSGMTGKQPRNDGTAGRWPANVILSHSLFCTDDACADDCPVALLDAQSGERKSGGGNKRNTKPNQFRAHIRHRDGHPDYSNDSGGASRFYYVAKASRRERGDGNNHPTVKPVDLMRYLVRLITPPGGTVLDPFGGSGTTALACLAEGFECVLIEREQDYAQIAESRIARWSAN